MNTISYGVNNGGTLELRQIEHDGKVLIVNKDSKGNIEATSNDETFISSGDMVMLVNYYKYIKSNNKKCDFINPTGK